MSNLIEKSALVAEISKILDYMDEHYDPDFAIGAQRFADKLEDSIDTLEVKEVDLEEEIDKELDEEWYGEYINYNKFRKSAKHFFELGLSASNPTTAADRGTAEEIIINLKRVEKDYRIDLTREIEWLRNKVKKGE